MMLLLFLLLSTLANSDGEGTSNSLVQKSTQRDKNFQLSSGPCDENWFHFSLLNSCYQFFSDKKTWMAAEDFCNQLPYSGHLASMNSSIHNSFMSDVVSAVDENKPLAWIGLNDRSEEGIYTWSDGSSYSYRNWSQGEPNDGGHNEDCVHIHYSGSPEWNDYPCGNKCGFICAYKLHCI
ncbi:C-type lectin-like [Hemitrygon akajei]|uniref:C-type lectin-like n=1 Tax=Hemitrygon akajei TaxID=2704970 RepID=UPI003BFA30A1